MFDDTGQKNRLACGLPSIAGYFVTANAEAADLSVEPLPNPSTSYPMGDYNYLTKKFPGSGKAVGVTTGNLATTEMQSAESAEAAKALGANIVYDQTYNALGESTWRPFAEALKTAGVKGLRCTGEPANLAKLLQASADINYKPDWVFDRTQRLRPRRYSRWGRRPTARTSTAPSSRCWTRSGQAESSYPGLPRHDGSVQPRRKGRLPGAQIHVLHVAPVRQCGQGVQERT